MESYYIVALYHFASLPNYQAMQAPIRQACQRHGVNGTLLLAHEGINGTIAGPRPGVEAVVQVLRTWPALAGLETKASTAAINPFRRLKVKLKREIVTMGVPGLDPATQAGTYVPAEQWNALITDPDVVTIDVRNDYEIDIGTFESAVNPETRTFSEFPQWVQQQSAPGGVLHGRRKVAMFCTGGIRCEKSTAYLKSQGFEEVYHLQGGILKYLETVEESSSRWQGECFVFDERVSVGHGLVPGPYQFCRGCRRPLNEADRHSALFEEGVSCPRCHAGQTPQDRERLRERQRQVELAHQRGEVHIGPSAQPSR